MLNFAFLGLVCFGTLAIFVKGFDNANVSHISYLESFENSNNTDANRISVPITLIAGADKKGAVCLDGSLPAYHWDRGSGSGANNWLIVLEGGGWCMDVKSCLDRKKSSLGSSKFMGKGSGFTGILSNTPQENPDFFNWNRIRLRYCDGASFAGEGQDQANQLYFRGQRIWSAAMEEFMAKGMRNAEQALLAGCSAGGVAVYLHCDQFKALFNGKTKVKCLSDAGFFLDTNQRFVRNMFHAVVTYSGAAKNLPSECTAHMDPTLCFFPQNIVDHIKTPLFILNAAYDYMQITSSLPPDPHHSWDKCKKDLKQCSPSQIQFFQNIRNQLLDSIKGFSKSNQNGNYINSCFTHCQAESQNTWLARSSPVINNKPISKAVGDWYFEREPVKLTDCPYPCGKNCRNMM